MPSTFSHPLALASRVVLCLSMKLIDQAPSSIRGQIFDHLSNTVRYYLDREVRFNTIAAFLGRPSDDVVQKLARLMTLTVNPTPQPSCLPSCRRRWPAASACFSSATRARQFSACNIPSIECDQRGCRFRSRFQGPRRGGESDPLRLELASQGLFENEIWFSAITILGRASRLLVKIGTMIVD